MIGHAQSNRFALGLHQPLGYFAGRLENKGVGARRGVAEQTVNGVIDTRVGAKLGEIPAHEGKIMVVPQPSDLANSIRRFFVAQLTTERVGRVGGIHHNPTLLDDRHCLLDQSGLRRLRVNGKKLTHRAKRARAPPDNIQFKMTVVQVEPLAFITPRIGPPTLPDPRGKRSHRRLIPPRKAYRDENPNPQTPSTLVRQRDAKADPRRPDSPAH